MKEFSAHKADWYWKKEDDQTQVYSSKRGIFVVLDDAEFIAWSSDGTLPSRVASNSDLGDVLARHRLRPTNASLLDAYQDTQAIDIIDATQFKIIFNHENRIRALERAAGLNGSPANLTAQQARAAIKVLL